MTGLLIQSSYHREKPGLGRLSTKPAHIGVIRIIWAVGYRRHKNTETGIDDVEWWEMGNGKWLEFRSYSEELEGVSHLLSSTSGFRTNKSALITWTFVRGTGRQSYTYLHVYRQPCTAVFNLLKFVQYLPTSKRWKNDYVSTYFTVAPVFF